MNTERRQAGWRSLSPLSIAERIHRDQRGSLSIMGVFSIFFLTVLLGMIFNVGRQVDDKLRMQNAADAAAYSGTLTVSRGMNAISYSNHLLCEIFALTAYMREARLDPNSTELPDWDGEALAMYPQHLEKHAIEHQNNVRRSQGLPPLNTLNGGYEGDVLDVWDLVARHAFVELGNKAGLGTLGYDKFVRLGKALSDKIPLERDMVRTFEPMAREHSRLTLSVFEYLLSGGDGDFPIENEDHRPRTPEGGLITRFQRSVVRFTPEMSQRVAQEIAERHGESTRNQHRGRDLTAVLYRTDASRFDEYREEERDTRLLPVIDPTFAGGDLSVSYSFDPRFFTDYSSLTDDQFYFKKSYDTRTQLAKHYLQEWIYVWLDRYFTQRHQERRSGRARGPYGRDVASLSQLANFWRIFTCAQLDKMLHEEFPKSNLPFVIRVKNRNNWDLRSGNPRFVPDQYALEEEYHCVAVVAWTHTRQFGPGIYRNPLNGDQRSIADDTYAFTFAEAKFFLPTPRYRCCPWGEWRFDSTTGTRYFITYYDNWPRDWSTFNQNWRTKLVPTWTVELPEMLARHPGGDVDDLTTPQLSNLTLQDIHLLNSH